MIFDKYLEIITLQNSQKLQSIYFKNKFLSIIAHIFTLLIVYLILIITSQHILRFFLFGLSLFFIFYWFVSIFTYLYKKSQYGTYTRIIQRFWKRSLYLFWLIEVSLFCIYLFLTIISPQEVAYMLDNIQLFFFFNNNLTAFFQSLLNVILLILLTNIYILSYKYDMFLWYIPVLIFILLLSILYLDFIQFYCINQHYNSFSWVHTPNELDKDTLLREDIGYDSKIIGVWEFEIMDLKLRTSIHYLYLLIFLKLWHTIFITMYFIFFENIRLLLNTNSYNILSSILQNFYFLLFFNYILKIFLIKHFGLYISEYIYYWFLINYHSYDLTLWVVLEGFNYLKFLVLDLLKYML